MNFISDGFPATEDDFYMLLIHYVLQGGGSRFTKDIQPDDNSRVLVSLDYVL